MTQRAFAVGMSGALLAATACAPTLVVDHAKERGTFQGAGVVGRDGGASVDGVWLYGDSFLGAKDADGSGFHSSSYTLATAIDDVLAGGTTPHDDGGAPLPFMPPTADERAFNLAHQARDDGSCETTPCGDRIALWPGTSVVDGDRVLTFYGVIIAGLGAYNFRSVGQSIATWTRGDPDHVDRPVLAKDPFAAHPTVLFPPDEPQFGIAAGVDDTDLVAFGCGTAGLGVPCKLGRVPLAQALGRSHWKFWDGDSYVDDVTQAATVFDGANIMTMAQTCDHRWLVVYSALLSNDVVARTADKPEGPWSDPVKLFTADHGDDSTVYDAYLHPELDATGRSLVVSYTRNTGFFQSVTVLEQIFLGSVTADCPAP